MSNPNIDPYEFIRVVPNADGTLTRDPKSFPSTLATPDPDHLHHHTKVLSKDVSINPSNNTWVRIFLPRQALDSSPSLFSKLPLIVYYHGGGFVIASAASTINHEFCSDLAINLPAIVVSVEYRLAPEHRLPAAYDDAMEALQYCALKTTPQDEWLTNYADFRRCFLMGTSAGGNIAYHAGLLAAAGSDNLFPLMIRGLILHHPYFGGVKRTESELRLINDPFIPLSVNDLLWELSLPIGSDRDHEFSNPTVGGGSKLLDQIRLLGCKVMVIGCDGDPLIDRQMEMAKIMEQKDMQVVSHFSEGGQHGLELFDPEKRKVLQVAIKNFISP